MPMKLKTLFLRKTNFFITFLLLSSVTLQAQDTLYNNKVISNAQMLGIGTANVLDTYLSQEKYNGTELRYISHTVRENGSKVSRELIHQAQLIYTHNRRDNNNELGGYYNFQYNWQYVINKWTIGNGDLRLKAGGGIDTRLGFLYNTSNANNPAQAYGQLNIAPNVTADYHFHLWEKPFCLRYGLQIPLIGLAFSPNYGQSYYEIFTQGNYDHNLVFTTPINAPSLRQMVTIDFTLHHTTFRLGYLGDYQQAKMNGLRQHTWSNLFVLGIVRTFSINKILP